MVRVPVLEEPLIPLLPDHAPEAVQAVALVALQVSRELDPLVMLVGLAVKVTAGAGCVTETVVVWVTLPPGPWQVSP